ncbi:uncharacterized protein EKO05_0009861 [Ascochyta rabiei]|uniref:uncharacterized protein n=1 Tax=Didymella rabiei TaxID=5454 RepID=UPI0021FFCCF0|nr:uncharacterized protein EKO05_0009861 [Ascochyta rabiei]UPX19603.1 hypothetical protein EKO05_0009861 [Ascochyta rabiei]
MSSKRLFSWQKRQSNAEPYYKTGGLLSIDALEGEPSNAPEAKDTQKARRRPSNLTIIPPEHQHSASSPLSSPYNVRRVSSTSNLMAIFNDMLRSPSFGAAAWPRSASVHKSLSTRPRSSSVPSSPDLPVELPGSLLQQNQGFPYFENPYFETPDFVLSRPTSQNVRRGTHPPDRCAGDEGDVFDLLHLVPEPLNHSRSVPSLNPEYQESAMKSSRSETVPNANVLNKSKPHRVHHRKALSDIEWRTLADTTTSNDINVAEPSASKHVNANYNSNKLRVKSGKLPQPSSMILEAAASFNILEVHASRGDDLGVISTPTPTRTRSKHTGDLKATIATQDQTISTLQSRFGSLRLSHEAHVSSLADAHAAEVASLRNHAKLLEEQLAQRPGLHHASGDNFLFLLDTTEFPSTLSRESSQYTANTSRSSTLSFQSASGKHQRSPEGLHNMESLKRKLSTTRRPQTADRNLLPELNQYKQNNVALETQIGSLMAKLNESKKSEKALRTTLQHVEQKCAEAESKAREVQQLASSAEALQNTIDHLESRLEIANTEKLDAQEELFNMRALKSPFDAQFSGLQSPIQDAHVSMDTVFSADTQPDRQRDSAATLSTFVAHIEQLQDEVRQKDAYISDLKEDTTYLHQMLDHVNRQYDEINLQLEIQNKLLGKTKETDEQIEQLRAAIMKREAVIGDKEKSIRAIERQLEHHQLLLQAEIRKHATMSRHLGDESNPLPELTALATKKDIDRWIQKLNQRLQKAKSMSPAKEPATAVEAHVEDLRNEIDFYVREIVYYKLDIRGYKSDIKKLNKITAQLGSYGNRASDLESETSSLRPAPTPNRARFLSTTPELKSPGYSSPALIGSAQTIIGPACALTPPPSMATDSPSSSPILLAKDVLDDYEEAASRIPVVPHIPTQVTIVNVTHNTPSASAPERQDTQRSMGNSTVHMYASPRTPGGPAVSTHDEHSVMLAHAIGISDRTPLQKVNLSHEPVVQSNQTPMTELTLPIISDIYRPNLEREVSETSTVRPVVPISRFSSDLPLSSSSSNLHPSSHSPLGLGSSATNYTLQSQSSLRPERGISTTSSNGIPFVIAMGSPHNPAIAVAAKNKPLARPHKSSTTSRIGVGGTMSSSTPFSSPTSIESFPSAPANSPMATTGHKRKSSLSFRKQENDRPTTPTHARSISGGSIRTAIRWTRAASRDKENEKEVQLRKDSIGMPQSLDGSFGIDQSTFTRVGEFSDSLGDRGN